MSISAEELLEAARTSETSNLISSKTRHYVSRIFLLMFAGRHSVGLNGYAYVLQVSFHRKLIQTSDKAPLFCRFCTSPSFMMDFSLDINFLVIFLIVPRSIWCDSKTRICLSDLRWFEASSTLNPTATKPLTIPSEPFEYRKRRSCCISCECRAQLMQLMDVCHFSGFQLYIVCGGRWFRITSFETKKIGIMVSPPTNFTKHLYSTEPQHVPTPSKVRSFKFWAFWHFLLRDFVHPRMGKAGPSLTNRAPSSRRIRSW